MRFLFLLITFAAGFAADLERRSVFTIFPEIAFDERKAYFANSEWVGVYAGDIGAMFTVSRDSIDLPSQSQDGRGCQVYVGNATYVCNPLRGNSIIKQDAFGSAEKVIPPPNDLALRSLSDAWKLPNLTRAEITEEIGPLVGTHDKVWFGLVAYHGRGQDPVAGLGWFDSNSETFGRVYSPALQDLTPRWVGSRSDTVWVYCAATGIDAGGKLITYAIRDGALGMVNLAGCGVPGDTLLTVAMWRDNLLMTTEKAVCVWPTGELPWVWQADAYATLSGTYLKFLTFDAAAGLHYVGDNFFPLPKNKPAQAFTRIGDWIEILAPTGIEAMIATAEWKKRKTALQSANWGCGDNLCFARVKISSEGTQKGMDLIDTPLIPLEEGEHITKVGMRAGWVSIHDLVPVLIKK